MKVKLNQVQGKEGNNQTKEEEKGGNQDGIGRKKEREESQN